MAQTYDAALYDLDGVLYLGDQEVGHAAESVRAAVGLGMRAAYVTNNASRAAGSVAEHLTRLGIPAETEDVVTSAQAVGRWLAREIAEGSPVLVLGTDALRDEVQAAGMRLVGSADDQPAAVVQGLDKDITWAQLSEAGLALRAGARWVAGNGDATYPTSRGLVPGNGAFVALLVAATGREPVVVGKPGPELHAASVERVGASRPLVVGDRLDTDVLGAVRGGADSLLVLTGVTDLAELLAAPLGQRPSFVAPDLRGLLSPQPSVTVDGEVARCGSVQVREGGSSPVRSDGQDLLAGPDAVLALRAACALAWRR